MSAKTLAGEVSVDFVLLLMMDNDGVANMIPPPKSDV
jgi:hypothetical protein